MAKIFISIPEGTNSRSSAFRPKKPRNLVSPTAPTLSAISATPSVGVEPLTVAFAVTPSGTSPFTYSWNFGDGSPVSTSAAPSHEYTEPGIYVVTVTVTNTAGSAQRSTNITVTAATPSCDPVEITGVTASVLAGNTPLEVDFTATATGTAPISYSWNFGDGSAVSTQQNPTHEYTVAGLYTVVLTTTNECGTDSDFSLEISVQAVAPPPPPAPLAALWLRVGAMLIGKNTLHDSAFQDEIAKVGIAVLGTYRGQYTKAALRTHLQAIKAKSAALGRSVKIGNYSNMVEVHSTNPAYADVYGKCVTENWLLKTAAGTPLPSRIVGSPSIDVNFTDHCTTDGSGDRFPQWKARRDFQTFYQDVPEWDFAYFDNVLKWTRQFTPANWRLDAVDVNGQTDANIKLDFRKAHGDWYASFAALAPTLELFGNPDGAGTPDASLSALSLSFYTGVFDAAYLEGAIGPNTSFIETFAGWSVMMARLQNMATNMVGAKRVVMRASITLTDYQKARYAMCSAWLTSYAYISITDSSLSNPYVKVTAYDEMDQLLGAAQGVNYTTVSTYIHHREYEGGLVIVNSHPTLAQSFNPTTVGAGLWKKFTGTQAPTVNDGTNVTGSITLQPKDGIVLLKREV